MPYGASRCVLHQGEYLALANWVSIPPTVRMPPPEGARGPLGSYLPRLSRSPAQFFHHSRHFSLALSRAGGRSFSLTAGLFCVLRADGLGGQASVTYRFEKKLSTSLPKAM